MNVFSGFKVGQIPVVSANRSGSYVIVFENGYYADQQPDTFDKPTNITTDITKAAKFRYYADAVNQSKRLLNFEPHLTSTVEHVSTSGTFVTY